MINIKTIGIVILVAALVALGWFEPVSEGEFSDIRAPIHIAN